MELAFVLEPPVRVPVAFGILRPQEPELAIELVNTRHGGIGDFDRRHAHAIPDNGHLRAVERTAGQHVELGARKRRVEKRRGGGTAGAGEGRALGAGGRSIPRGRVHDGQHGFVAGVVEARDREAIPPQPEQALHPPWIDERAEPAAVRIDDGDDRRPPREVVRGHGDPRR
jgi:hypothetical protein